MEKELHILRKVVQELLKTPKVLMERLTKRVDLNCFLSSVRRGDNDNNNLSYSYRLISSVRNLLLTTRDLCSTKLT